MTRPSSRVILSDLDLNAPPLSYLEVGLELAVGLDKSG